MFLHCFIFFTVYTSESQATKLININNTHKSSERSSAVRRQTFESSSDMRSSVILKFLNSIRCATTFAQICAISNIAPPRHK